MRNRSTGSTNDAIIEGAPLCRDDLAGEFDGPIVPERIWFALMVRRVWPVKAPMAVVQYAGCAERTARAYASADREPSASVLCDLLRGAEGDAILSDIMRHEPPAWFVRFEHALRVLAAIEEVTNGRIVGGTNTGGT